MNGWLVSRISGLMVGVLTFLVVASAPASAAQWDYDLKTTDGDPGGQAIGRVYYESIGGGCFRAGVDGYVYDREADGYSVIIYFRARSCSDGRWANIEAGYVAGNGKREYYNSGYLYGWRDVTARVCLYKNSNDHYCRTA